MRLQSRLATVRTGHVLRASSRLRTHAEREARAALLTRPLPASTIVRGRCACVNEHPERAWLLRIGGRPGPRWRWYAEVQRLKHMRTRAHGREPREPRRVGPAQVRTGLRLLPVGLGMIDIQYAPCDHDPTFACPIGGSVTDQTPSRLFFRWRPHRGL
ncbi:hypothetical protein HYPSUDRAFT_287214 [Hypholoma sublateritium FD-334 SS-4]|uniref:Uncharacterized protein n=1 Tax=Hypholoma sublateritium (strain FD-334 SS-4) TaxID=945553 RepID=A0A0D2M067_HYPSF|nr:hypothetical protein HYPSUDRAFT_287214 [Hypholoma sublateritium FD-334 SS-4]